MRIVVLGKDECMPMHRDRVLASGDDLRGEVCISYAAYIFNLFFFNLLATLFNSAFRQQPTIRSVKRKRDISRSPVKCDGVGGYFPETLNTKGNFHIGKSQQPSITSLLPLPSTSSFLSLSRLNPTILPISISSPLPLSPSLFRSRNTFTSRCHFTR
jgi:hypothetical protein